MFCLLVLLIDSGPNLWHFSVKCLSSAYWVIICPLLSKIWYCTGGDKKTMNAKKVSRRSRCSEEEFWSSWWFDEVFPNTNITFTCQNSNLNHWIDCQNTCAFIHQNFAHFLTIHRSASLRSLTWRSWRCWAKRLHLQNLTTSASLTVCHR